MIVREWYPGLATFIFPQTRTMMTMNTTSVKKALVVCDMQPDVLNSITPVSRRQAVLHWVRYIVQQVRQQQQSSSSLTQWKIVWTGLRFQPGYEGIASNHKLYGSLVRLHKMMGEEKAHWFLPGYPGSDLEPTLSPPPTATGVDNDDDQPERVFWRSRHCPSPALVEYLHAQKVSHVILVGLKLSASIQLLAQHLCDAGMSVDIPTCAIADDDNHDSHEQGQQQKQQQQRRQDALLQHLLPLYANIIRNDDIHEWLQQHSLSTTTTTADSENDGDNHKNKKKLRWVCNVGRGGHGALFMAHLLQHFPDFQPYPKQLWYQSSSMVALMNGGAAASVASGQDGDWGQAFYCPLDQARVDFCDEPQFSQVSMYLAGRERLDEKDKLADLVRKHDRDGDPNENHNGVSSSSPPTRRLRTPDTYIIQNGQWHDRKPPASTPKDSANEEAVWFLKETNKNGGKAVRMYKTADACLQAARQDNNNVKGATMTTSYVVQKHIARPILTRDGYKCHVKFYILLTCAIDGKTWTLYTCKDAYLAVADEPWSPMDPSPAVQITTLRHQRLVADAPGLEERWPVDFYKPCQETVETWLRVAIEEDRDGDDGRESRLRGRPGQAQFEIMSVDLVFVEDDPTRPYLIEFNGGPVLFDPTLTDQVLATRGLRRYHHLYQMQGDDAVVNDHKMIKHALEIVLNGNDSKQDLGRWDKAATFSSQQEHP